MARRRVVDESTDESDGETVTVVDCELTIEEDENIVADAEIEAE